MQRLVTFSVGLALLSIGCSQTKATTMEWVRVETDDLVIRTDVREAPSVELVTRWQRLRDAIAENELPCAFERNNAPFEFVLLKDPAVMEDLSRAYTSSFSAGSPSDRLHSKTQFVLDYREALRTPQVFLHQLVSAATALCFPSARPWLRRGMSAFYETASVRDGKLILGMPPYGFVQMDNIDPRGDVYEVRANGAIVWMLPLRRAPDFDELRLMDEEEFYFLNRRRSVEELRQRTAHSAGSWNAVHMLQFSDPAMYERFRNYLTWLNRGKDNDTAWDAAFEGVDVAASYDVYLTSDYKMSSRKIATPPARAPSTHGMTDADIGLLMARLYGWSNDEDAAKAEAFIEAAESSDPNSSAVLLHRAAFDYDRVSADAGAQWLERALEQHPDDPNVLATAILWYAGGDTIETRRADLDRWAERLEVSAQTAFEFRELARYQLFVARDPKAALEPINRSLTLDATDWRSYAYAGRALAELDRPEQAIGAYQTAIALSAEEPDTLRTALKKEAHKLRGQEAPSKTE